MSGSERFGGGVSGRARDVTIRATRERLDDVARRVGLDDGRVLEAMLARPSTTFGVTLDDYIACVNHCSNTLEGPALEKCIEGCSKVESSFTAATHATQ
jgi:hypothetical protein